MQRIAAGDDDAMAEFLANYGPMLARVLGRLCAWHSDVDDLFQEVLLKIWQRSATYQASGSLEAWLHRIAANQCKNHFRSLSTMRRNLEQWFRLRPDPDHELPENKLEYQEIDPELKMALAQLSTDDRTAVVFVYLEELSIAEVASMLNLTTNALHVRLTRAKKKMKTTLQERRHDAF